LAQFRAGATGQNLPFLWIIFAPVNSRAALGDGFRKLPFHKIVCIGALIASRSPEGRAQSALPLWLRQGIQELLREGDFSLMPFRWVLNRQIPHRQGGCFLHPLLTKPSVLERRHTRWQPV